MVWMYKCRGNDIMGKISKDILQGLIKDGFDINLIAFELDIPIEKLKEYQLELEKSSSKNIDNLIYRKKVNNDISNMEKNINKMRKKYFSLHEKNESKKSIFDDSIISVHKVSVADLEKNNLMIDEIYRCFEEGNDKLPDEKRKIAREVYNTLCKSLDVKKLSLEQAVRLYDVLNHNLLKTYHRYPGSDDVARKFLNYKKDVIKVLFDYISEKSKYTDDLKELESLKEIAFKIDDTDNKIVVSTIRGNITNKIRRIKNQRLTDELKVVPEEIIKIVEQLVLGNLNIQNARKVIESEAEKLVQDKKANGYSQYKYEDAKKRLEDQIHALLREDAKKYRIECIEELIEDLEKLTNKTRDAIIRTIIANLTERGEYMRAKALCEMCKGTDRNSDEYKNFQGIKHSVERIEIGNSFLRLMNEINTKEEEIELYSKVMNARKNGINLDNVSLGKSVTGKELRLSYILDDEIEF